MARAALLVSTFLTAAFAVAPAIAQTAPADPTEPEAPEPPPPEPTDVQVQGTKPAPSRGAADHRVEVGELAIVPKRSASDLLKLTPSVFLLKDGGGEGHADRIYLRGFDAREGQDVEFSIGGVPINESANYHGSGYADLNFIIPELVRSVRVLQGPYDPRQGNFAVAGSADYELGLDERGVSGKVTYGSWNTARFLALWAPEGESTGTYAGAEIFHTDGYGQNRDAWRARGMGQYEGRIDADSTYRIAAVAYGTEYHSAGLLREADVESGKKDFYDAGDPNQGGTSMRFHLAGDVETRRGPSTYGFQAYGIYRSLRLKENFTGFLLDPQRARETPHGQRGDLADLSSTQGTFGMRGFGRYGFDVLGLKQEVEVGVFTRGDVASNVQQRIKAGTDVPYRTDADFDAKLGDFGLYGDIGLRLQPWLVLRGGVRADLFVFDVQDNCAVKDVSRPAADDPPGDASCLSQERFGDHREPNQKATTASAKPMPRASMIVGPFAGFSFSLAYGQGVRAIDPSYVSDDVATPFASIDSGDIGASYARSFGSVLVTGSSSFFATHVDQDQIFSETEGRATLAQGTTRVGWSGTIRTTGDWFDTNTSASLVKSRFDDTGLLVPYVPDVVFRHDGALFYDLFDIDGSPFRGKLGLGATVIGQRALPFGQRSDVIFTLDAAISGAWRWLELEIAGTNLANLKNKDGEFNFPSDFDPTDAATLVPARHFSAGAPIGVFASLTGRLGEGT
ncbi:MAG: TonB-dependent receptor plug domain-containing protein [Polyangiaceae bacterium]|nr:TonB-dependent receptor plug domain-containing protein [Polyangiaceae bacterium]